MRTALLQLMTATAILAAQTMPVLAQSGEGTRTVPDTMQQISNHMGEMTAEMGDGDLVIDDSLRFEPFQQLEEMFLRDDVVFLMRHGPTDWSKLDVKDVAPGDCADQRILSPQGTEDMRNLGTLLASNGVLPSEIVVSQWCRNQQTLDALSEGFDRVDPQIAAEMPLETDPELNLLLSLQGAKNTTALRERISAWDGHATRSGPLLIVSHYTNIEELTQFRVFEGEILVLDPKRDNQVLGYLRLKSAQPDVGHFADALELPLMQRQQALDMIDRYYQALNAQDGEMLQSVLNEGWIERGEFPSIPDQDAEGFLDEVTGVSSALDGSQFEVEDVYLAEDFITVRGTITGRHTGMLFGVPPTNRMVSFGALAVHRISDGGIAESWQMVDWKTLMTLITG